MNIKGAALELSLDASPCDNSNVKKCRTGGYCNIFLALGCPINIYQHE